MNSDMTLIERINDQLATLKLAPLNSEQVDCLSDRARLMEAVDMLDDLTARCGLRLPPQQGIELGPAFADEEQARVEAEGHARRFDAVCIEEMATDDHRSFGGREYRIVAFAGPLGAFTAAHNPIAIAYWVAGQERQD